MRVPTIRVEWLVLGTFVVLFLVFDMVTPFVMFYQDRTDLWHENKAFHTEERELLAKYPRVMGPVFDKSIEFTNHGVAAPALRNMWQTASVFDVPRRAISRVSSSLLLRILSPQDIWELALFWAVAIVCIVAASFISYLYFNNMNTRLLFSGIASAVTSKASTSGTKRLNDRADALRIGKRITYDRDDDADDADDDDDGDDASSSASVQGEYDVATRSLPMVRLSSMT